MNIDKTLALAATNAGPSTRVFIAQTEGDDLPGDRARIASLAVRCASESRNLAEPSAYLHLPGAQGRRCGGLLLGTAGRFSGPDAVPRAGLSSFPYRKPELGALALAVEAAFDDEVVAGRGEPVDGGLGQELVVMRPSHSSGGLVGGDHGGVLAVLGDDQLVEVAGAGLVERSKG
jgi:hypothetical protein